MADADAGFDYANLNDRPPGRLARWGSRVSRGIRTVQAQVPAYAAAWEERNRAAVAAASGGPLWVVLGDSMAQGIGASAYDRGWPGQLADRVPGLAAYRLVNLSFYGAGVADVVQRQWPAVAGLGPIAVVTVVIGSNDLFGRGRREGLERATAAMLAALPAGSVVANLPQPQSAARMFNARLREVAARRGLRVADFAGDRIDWRGKLSPDHFHPGDAGYAAMADVLAPAVREALAARGG